LVCRPFFCLGDGEEEHTSRAGELAQLPRRAQVRTALRNARGFEEDGRDEISRDGARCRRRARWPYPRGCGAVLRFSAVCSSVSQRFNKWAGFTVLIFDIRWAKKDPRRVSTEGLCQVTCAVGSHLTATAAALLPCGDDVASASAPRGASADGHRWRSEEARGPRSTAAG
jgi:hypothetical protein